MKLSEKVKIALDETRILILGAQILLGFGFRGVFSERFDELPGYARYADGIGPGLLVCVIGLLIAPGPYHRIAEGGQDSGRLHRFVTVIADLALLPFALALGLGLFVGTEAIFDDSVASAAAGAGAGLALALWYGLPQLRKRFVGEKERMITRGQSNELPLHVKIEQWLTRRVPAGAAFRLRWHRVALAVMMLMAPAPYHRIVYAGEDTEDMYQVGSVLVTGATLPLGLGLAGDIYVRNREDLRVFRHRVIYRRAGIRAAEPGFGIYTRLSWRAAASRGLLANSEYGQNVISDRFRR